MRHTFKTEFYRVSDGDDESFAQALTKIASKLGIDRTVQGIGRPIHLSFARPSGTLVSGEFLRVRLDDLPVLAGLDGNPSNLNLPASRGLGEPTSFLFSAKQRVVLLQRTRSGVSALAFEQFFGSFAPDDQMLGKLTPIIRPESMKRFLKFSRVKRLSIQVEPQRVSATANRNTGVSGVTAFGTYLDSATISISASPQRNGSLNLDRVRRVVEALFGTQGVERLRVEGANPADSDEMLDFLLDRLVDVSQISPAGRTTTPQERLAALREAWKRHAQSIDNLND